MGWGGPIIDSETGARLTDDAESYIHDVGRVRVGDLITHVGATDVQFSSADVVRDLLDKVREMIDVLLCFHSVADRPSQPHDHLRRAPAP